MIGHRGAPVVEREPELAKIREVIARTRAGDSGLLVVRGEAGVGKSTILEVARRECEEQGFLVLHGRASELEQSSVWALARRLFGDQPSHPAGSREPLRGVRELFGPQSQTWDREYGVAHRAIDLLTMLAEVRPVLLSIDDLHWGDPASLQLIEFVAARAEGQRLLVLGAARPATPTSAPKGLLARLDEADSLVLAPLSTSGAASLVEELTAQVLPDAIAAEVHRVTGGSPFLLAELCRWLRQHGLDAATFDYSTLSTYVPEAITLVVSDQLAALSSDQRALADAVAILGDHASAQKIALLSGLGEAQIAAETRVLQQLGVFEEGEDPAFRHPMIETAVRSMVDANTLAQAHRQASILLADAGAPPEEIAAHLLMAHPEGNVRWVRTLTDAGIAARAGGSPELAVSLLSRALDEPPPSALRGEVAAELGLAELDSGALAPAIIHVREALGLATSPDQVADRAIDLASAVLVAQGPAHALEVIADAIGRIGDDESDSALRLVAHAYQYSVFDEDNGRSWLEGLLARRRPPPDGPGARAVLGLMALANAMYGGTAADSRALALDVFLHGAAGSELVADGIPFMAACYAAVECGAYDVVAGQLEQASRLAQAQGSPATQVNMSLGAVYLGERLGDLRALEESIAVARMALAVKVRSRSTFIAAREAFFGVAEAVSLSDRGAPQDVEQALERVQMDGSADGDHQPWIALPWRTRARLRTGNLSVVGSDLSAIETSQQFFGIAWTPTAPWRAWKAMYLSATQGPAAGRNLAEEELRYAEAWGGAHAIGTALRARAFTESGPEAVPWLRDAVAAFDRGGADLERARAQVDLGAALRRAGRKTDAREQLDLGTEGAEKCGATTLAARARDELALAGSRPRRHRIYGPDSLTAAERRVARMAADGLSNREIAQQLYVSMKTVEGHLRQVYGKLSIDGRSGLRDALDA